ncbi:MAG: phytoene/squalene synthase family protein [Rubrivivax sp.]|nr:phytoene/squalene synthase family protein [Rubrivivax sp.]
MNARELNDCRALMRGGSRSFFLASLALPARVCAPASALYAFCRVADDLVDDGADPSAALQQLHQRLDAIYAGRPGPALEDRALAAVVHGVQLPRLLLDALLEGFAWDAQGRRYDTIEQVHDYAARVAGTVGAMMALVMESPDRCALARACELGVAMQLTNIARDVGEDARRGRLYLPRDWLRAEGLDPEAWLQDPRFDDRLARVIERLLAEADRLYARAECGVAHLPRDCRAAIQAARLVYAEIGQALRRRGHDSVSSRTVVGTGRKLALLGRAMGALLVPPGRPLAAGAASAPLPAVRHLVEAAASEERPSRTFYQRTVRVLELFERQQLRRAS